MSLIYTWFFSVFCNRNLGLSKIKYMGFDMDYTLAEYKVSFGENEMEKKKTNKQNFVKVEMFVTLK